ncbi:hypothetical protein D3C77_725240 [compost metagenome]
MVTVTWGDTKLTLYPQQGSLVAETSGSGRTHYPITVEKKNDAHWISLRTLLTATGHEIKAVTSSQQESRVKAF